METSAAYQEHISIAKQYKMHSDYTKAREPYKEDFEKIYERAKESDVKLDSAKDFLNNLTPDELKTLQNYARLVDDIVVNTLSDEGAYNLLVHSYEKYDFNDDGIAENGIGKNIPMIPQNMDKDTKQAFVNALNSLSEKDRFMANMVLTFDISRLNKSIAQHFQNMPQDKRDAMQEYLSFDIDKFIMDTLSKSHKSSQTTYDSISKRADSIINPPPQAYSSPELKSSMSKFITAFEKEYSTIKEQQKTYPKQPNIMQASKESVHTTTPAKEEGLQSYFMTT
jgi:hypothetical protein